MSVISENVKRISAAAERWPVVGVLMRAGMKASNYSAKDMAASIAYFTFLSIFPLLLGLVAIAGHFLKSEELSERLVGLIVDQLPASADFVTQNVEGVVRLRGAAGLTSIVVLLWSARKMVGAIRRGVNNALGQRRKIAFYLSPLYDYGTTLLVALLMLFSTSLGPLFELLADVESELISSRWQAVLDAVAGRISGFVVSAIVLTMMYLLVAYQRPNWKHIAPGVIVATCLIEVGKTLFVDYVENVSRLDATYGSVSSIIVLLIWLYFSARVLLYGAEVISVYQADVED